MAHESIQPESHGPYYEGDAIHIPVQILEQDEQTPIDISTGHVTLTVKNERTDTEAESLMTKSTDIAGEGEIVDGANGEAIFYVDTGDTDEFLGTTERVIDDDFFVIIRFHDGSGNRVGTVEATWTITAS